MSKSATTRTAKRWCMSRCGCNRPPARSISCRRGRRLPRCRATRRCTPSAQRRRNPSRRRETMSDLYAEDILLWSERQGELLGRRAAGELVNDRHLDWPNIAEEIESAGSEQLHAVELFLVQALAHMLKAEAWPTSHEVPGWRAEARRFRDDAASRFVPSMRQRIAMAKLYRRAL